MIVSSVVVVDIVISHHFHQVVDTHMYSISMLFKGRIISYVRVYSYLYLANSLLSISRGVFVLFFFF